MKEIVVGVLSALTRLGSSRSLVGKIREGERGRGGRERGGGRGGGCASARASKSVLFASNYMNWTLHEIEKSFVNHSIFLKEKTSESITSALSTSFPGLFLSTT